jgi:hypothetical protein
MKDAKPAKTPMGTDGHVDLNKGGKSVDQKAYRSMIGCGGQISPGSTRRLEDLAKCFGPDISQGHPFVGLGRNI